MRPRGATLDAVLASSRGVVVAVGSIHRVSASTAEVALVIDDEHQGAGPGHAAAGGPGGPGPGPGAARAGRADAAQQRRRCSRCSATSACRCGPSAEGDTSVSPWTWRRPSALQEALAHQVGGRGRASMERLLRPRSVARAGWARPPQRRRPAAAAAPAPVGLRRPGAGGQPVRDEPSRPGGSGRETAIEPRRPGGGRGGAGPGGRRGPQLCRRRGRCDRRPRDPRRAATRSAPARLTPLLAGELRRICRDAGIRLLGPGSLGLVNTDPATGLDLACCAAPARAGAWALVSDSGPVIATRARGPALARARRLHRPGHRARRRRPACDLLPFAAADPRTAVAAVCLHAVADLAALTRAVTAGLGFGCRCSCCADRAAAATAATAGRPRAATRRRLDAWCRRTGVTPGRLPAGAGRHGGPAGAPAAAAGPARGGPRQRTATRRARADAGATSAPVASCPRT